MNTVNTEDLVAKLDAILVEQMRVQALVIADSKDPINTAALLNDLTDLAFSYMLTHNDITRDFVAFDKKQPFWKKYLKL